MIFLKNDYSTGAHPDVLQALVDNNMVFSDSYSHDDFCAAAETLIRDLIKCPDADIHFMSGGTQTNLVCMSSFMRPYEAVIAADSGHISVHETGAIEATGHKCIELASPDGKILPEQIEKTVAFHNFDQMVLPRVVYISDTTESGSVYTKAEITALRDCCRKHGMYLYLDGARLAMALSAAGNDITFEDLPELVDAFYIGGTKCGALFGEAAVIINDDLKENFRFNMRQRGALFAKGMVIGMQFGALLSNGLYTKLGEHANRLALDLAEGIKAKGYSFAYEPESNMIFPIFTNEQAAELAKEVMFETWLVNDDGTTTIRLVTSWSSTQEDVEAFLALI
ncbi:MAG: aminotransferase class V-fold PLP-dependent enzyme [Eubacteriaceae bacterium]|jgi:threonine aldolase|nr:aminotransferase class V-fold PLP-dependent enzyme [Eubacteriaceae bacterium]